MSAIAASRHTCRAESSAAQEKLIQPVSQEMGLNQQSLTREAFLYELVRAECLPREDHRVASLQRLAGLPPDKTFRSPQLEHFLPLVREHGVESHETSAGESPDRE